MLLMARLPYRLPHLPGLRGPRLALGEEVMPRLGLAAGAPPALARVRCPAPTCLAIHSAVSQDLASVATPVMGEGGFLAVPLWSFLAWSAAAGCSLRVLVGYLIAAGALLCAGWLPHYLVCGVVSRH